MYSIKAVINGKISFVTNKGEPTETDAPAYATVEEAYKVSDRLNITMVGHFFPVKVPFKRVTLQELLKG
jgi:hypothetical protein